MSDLTDFLRARLDEDEYVAERAGSHGSSQGAFVKDNYGALLVDPAHVLRDIEAKRQLVRMHGELHDDVGDTGICGEDYEGYPCATLRLLASVYADHPDYREEWRPTRGEYVVPRGRMLLAQEIVNDMHRHVQRLRNGGH